jgi:hypothetical protein
VRSAAIGSLLVLVACGKTPVQSPPDASTDAPIADAGIDDASEAEAGRFDFDAFFRNQRPCTAPLTEYVGHRTYESALLDAKSIAASLDCRHAAAETGVCGAYLYVSTPDRLSFFAENGQIVGVYSGRDYAAFCNRSSLSIAYGTVPTCTRKPKAKLCRKIPSEHHCLCGDPLCEDDAGCARTID